VRRTVITLILSIIVFVTTILVSITYISRKSLETADYFNNLSLDRFQDDLNDDILLTNRSAFSFLTGIPAVYVGKDSTSIIIDETELTDFRNALHESLIQFMRINKYYHTSMFIIDRDICRRYFHGEGAAYIKHCSNGFVPAVLKGDNALYDLSDLYDFMGSDHYQQIKSEGKILWTTHWSTFPAGRRLLTLHVPITLSDGEFFGVFALSLNIETLNDKLKNHLPSGEDQSAIFIVDEDDVIISSYPEWIMEPDIQEQIRNSTDLLKRHDKGTEHSIIKIDSEEYYVYQRDDLSLPWRVFTSNNAKAIYREAKYVVKAMILSSITGMILMLVCCVVIFHQIRKDLRKNAAIEEELRMAAMVQTSMLKPTAYNFSNNLSPVTINAFLQPAKKAGGDLYDYIEKDGKLIFCIGDVSGKGIPAALFMTQVVSLFRNAVRYTLEPSEIVSQINNVLSDNSEMIFCTFFVGVICRDEIKFCNAGHNPPVFFSPHPAYLDVKPNLAIGLMEGYPYRSETISFRPGDRLVLYTDGVTEAKDKKHRQYGEERLIKTLDSLSQRSNIEAGQSINTAILTSIEQFTQHAEQSDDITIVSIVNRTLTH